MSKARSLLSAPLRVAFCGVGGFARTRRRQLALAGGFELVGALEPSDAAFAAAQAEEGGGLVHYRSLEELVDDPRVEAVMICSPPGCHLEQAFAAVERGLAIFTEKPLGHELEGSRRLVQLCEERGIAHGHGLEVRFTPLWQHVKGLLESEAIGRVISVSIASMHSGGLMIPKDNWRHQPGGNPGGPLFQIGIHKLDLAHFLFGKGEWTAGRHYQHVTSAPVEDGFVLLGAFGAIPVTFHSHYICSYRHSLEIYGTAGGIYCTESPTSLQLKQTCNKAGAEVLADLTADIPETNARLDALVDFAHAVRQRRQPVMMNGRMGLEALEMVFEALAVSLPLDAGEQGAGLTPPIAIS